MQNYEITTDINPQYLDHFKSQLMHVEASGSEVKFLFDGGGFQDRHESMKILLRRSFHDIPTSKTIRFWIFTGDNRPTQKVNNEPLFSISGQRNLQDFVLPDPYVVAWNDVGVKDYTEYCKSLNQESLSQKPEIIKAVWRGSVAQHVSRENMLRSISRKPDNLTRIFDFQDASTGKDSFVSMSDLKKWAIMLDFPGRGYSARLKYFMHIIRPKIVIERIDWDFATLNLEPGFHFASVPDDFNIINYTAESVISNYGWWIQKSLFAAEEMSKITERSNISKNLVEKVLRYA